MEPRIIKVDAIDFLNSLAPLSVDMIFTSPPYLDARSYGISAQRGPEEWVKWMIEVVADAHRACHGPVFVNCAGVTRGRNYWPGPEGLAWEWHKRGGDCHMYRPCCWRKVDNNEGGTGIPGSGGDDYLRADWEPVLCFKHVGPLPFFDLAAVGHSPKYAEVGGAMSNRTEEGQRINEQACDPWKTATRGGSGVGGRTVDGEKKIGPKTDDGFGGKFESIANRASNGKRKRKTMDITTGHDANGELLPNGNRPMPKIANPGNVIKARVGGGHMGSSLCHEGEAPFPEALVDFFVRAFCPPGGLVCDPFSGSGTTAAVAIRWGRRFSGCDLRQSQVNLGLKRLAQETPLTLLGEASHDTQ